MLDQVNKQQAISDTYYNRWQNVLSQMNTENALAEQIRQYNEKMKYQKDRDKVADKQWQKEFDLAKKASSSTRRSGSSGSRTSKSSKSGTTTLTNTSKTASASKTPSASDLIKGATASTKNAIKAVTTSGKAPSLSNSKAKELYKSATSGNYTYAQIKTALNSAVNNKLISSKDRDNILHSIQ